MRFALLAGLVLASSTSIAAPHGRGEPRLRDRQIVSIAPARAQSAFASLARRGWRAIWDRDTGVAARVWGSFVDAPGAVADPRVAEAAARRFLGEHLGVLAPGANVEDFVVVANHLAGGIRTVGFQQTWRGVPVVGGSVGFVFAHDRLFAIGSAAWPHVATATPFPRVRAVRGKRAILPRASGGAIAYHDVDVVEDALVRRYLEPGGRELARESRIMTATATLRYNAGVRYAAGVRADFAVPDTYVTIDDADAITGEDGTFSWPGEGPATVVPGLEGRYVRIIDRAGPLATTSLVAQPGDSVVWNLAGDEHGDAQLSAFVYVNRANAHARGVNPSVSAWLDTPLDVYVNENGSCNAYSTGNDIHFFRGDASCENTGRLADVVFHEFGHSLHASSVIDGMGAFEAHLSEGLADYFAADLTGDSAVGRGFFRDDSPLRDIDPFGYERVYPLDFDFDPHVSGLIISGALWDLRKALIAQLGQADGVARAAQIFTGIMQRADDIGTTFVAALVADDDDGDLGNGTPHYCAIERAFGTHGLVPDFATTRVSPPVVEGLSLAMSVDTPVGTTCPPREVVAIRVTWRAGDGVPSSFELARQGGMWTGVFPDQPDGTVISYGIEVVFDDGGVQRFPDNAADPEYQLFVGTAVPLFCETFDTDPMWEQSSNLGLEWQWGPPVIGQAGGDPDTAYTGTNVLGTDLSVDGRYRSNLDVSTSTPVIDVSAYRRVHLQYWRWLGVEDALYDQASILANDTEIWRNARSTGGTLDHVDREWRYHDIDVTPHVRDGSLRVTWRLVSDFGKELGGWTLDDVCVVGLGKIPRCGDGVLDEGEQCDDGNTDDGDGCDATCGESIVAGGGGCCDAGSGAPANAAMLVIVVPLACRRRRRAG